MIHVFSLSSHFIWMIGASVASIMVHLRCMLASSTDEHYGRVGAFVDVACGWPWIA